MHVSSATKPDPSAKAVVPAVLPRWLRSAHLQTLGVTLPLWLARSTAESVLIPIPLAERRAEQGALHARVDWQPVGEGKKLPAVVLVHGVGGSSESRYMIRAARVLQRAGFHVARLDMRGAGEGVRTAPSLYHAALVRDLATATAWLAADSRVDGVFVVGFSLGGHVTLRWAGELGEERPAGLRGVAALSAPLDLERCTQAIERLRSAPYHLYLANALREQGLAFAAAHPERVHYTERELRGVRTIRRYDSLVIAPMHGWKSAEDYYAEASAGPLLPGITVPTLVVHAEDDPLVPGRLVRPLLEGASSAVQQRWSAHGGHLGWFAGLGEESWLRTWAMDQVLDFIHDARGRDI